MQTIQLRKNLAAGLTSADADRVCEAVSTDSVVIATDEPGKFPRQVIPFES